MTSLWAPPSPKREKTNNVLLSEFPFTTSSDKHTPTNIKEVADAMAKSHEFEFNSLEKAVDF
eukprot:10071209-Ditylum_brightwellii.AAC.1